MPLNIHTLLFAFFAGVAVSAGCGKEFPHEREDRRSVETERTVSVRIHVGAPATRSVSPNEDRISDLNLFVFRNDAVLEERLWVDAPTLQREGIPSIRLPKGMEYTLYACVNFGYELRTIRTLEDLTKHRHHLAYPDEFSRGIPMSGIAEADGNTDTVTIPLERMMAKISLSVDRRALNQDVRLSVNNIVIGNTPRSATAFGTSRVRENGDVFVRGFNRTGSQTDVLNHDRSPGVSGELSFYMLENLQGEDPAWPSYIEIRADYDSDARYTPAGKHLIYRFLLGDGPGNYDVHRNFHYRFTVRPEGDGLLTQDSWKVDKSALTYY